MSNGQGENLGLPTSGGAPSIGPQQIAQFLQQIMGARQQQPQQAGGGGMSPARVGAVPNPPAVPNVGGMQPAGGPAAATATPGATEGGPGRFPQISPAPINQQTEFATKAGRNQAITQNALAGIGSAVQQYKQNQFQKKQQAAKAAVLQKAMMTMDPASQQQMQKLAQQDPKMAKIFEKQQADFAKYYDKAMTDPNSPEYYGFQQAYKELQQQAMTKDQMELVKAQINAEMQRAAQERATATLRTTQAAQEGQITPRVKFEEQERGKRVQAQVSGSLDRTREQTTAMLKATKERADAYRYAADKMAGSRKGGVKTPEDKAVEHIAAEYKNINAQIAELNKQAKDLQDNVAKTPITSWITGGDKKTQAQIDAISKQRDILMQQAEILKQKENAMIDAGALPDNINAPDENDTVDTEPITISPEDMNPTKPSAGTPK